MAGASFFVTPIEGISVRLTAERQLLYGNNADDIQVVGAALNPASPPANQLGFMHGLSNPTYLQQPSQNEPAVYYAHVNYDLGWSSLTSITGFTFGKFRSVYDATSTNAAAGVPIGASHAIAYYANQGGLNETGLATIRQPLTIGFLVRSGF